ncbi:hypothetical protein HY003_01035 [Candidatus Saccharibacteria bacterium]|nr:hypothetical protein [Candidatus Saccharibacteria bacterium]MBI3337862.1 hypothetical protein [Candidatus Saccharibacteria bacterium]
MAKKNNAPKNPQTISKSMTTRRLKQPKYHSFRLHKRIKLPNNKLPSSIKLFKQSIKHLIAYRRLFLGLVLIYFVLTVVLVKGLGFSSNIVELKNQLGDILQGNRGALTIGVSLFGLLVGSTGNTSSDLASLYQMILLITVSLAIIWALRQTHANVKVGVRDAFYKGLYPLVPFLLVLIVICIQFMPLVIGNWLYGTVIANGIAVAGIEKAMWALVLFFLTLLSLYLISSSVFALYIVTLPNMRPMQALQSARELVRYRHWSILRKVIFLPIALLLIACVIIVPLILFATPIVEWMFFGLSMLALAVVHSYMYTLYRELL